MATNEFDLGTPSAFIFHHTGGRSDPLPTLQQRGLGVQFIMDRDGNIRQVGGAGASHMRPGWGAGEGLSNKNTVGMEVIARDNRDVTPAQVAAAQKFIAEKYPTLPIYGHGEVNPGHKDRDEGLAIVNAIRESRGAPRPPMPIPMPEAPRVAAVAPPPAAPFSMAPPAQAAAQPPQQPPGPPANLMSFMQPSAPPQMPMPQAPAQPTPGLDEARQQSDAAQPMTNQPNSGYPPENLAMARALMAAMQRQVG